MTRTKEEILKAYSKATKRNPLVLEPEELEVFTKALAERNRVSKCGKLITFDRDSQFRNGVFSHVDKKTYGNRRTWDDHLKAHGCVEVGNEVEHMMKPRQLEGDFNVREELTRATREVLERNR